MHNHSISINKATFRLLALFICALISHFTHARLPEKQTFNVTKDIIWAQPKGIDLKIDIYVPNSNKATYPVIIIYHGGGWLINNKNTMDSLATYLVTHANYVICNVDYRLIGDNDNKTTMQEIVEDAFGAAIWVKENIANFQGDSSKIAVTGDSAGGHLAAMVTLCGNTLSSESSEGDTIIFTPTWLPPNSTVSNYKAKGGINVKAAILSYPALDLYKNCISGFETIVNPFWGFAKEEPRAILGDSISVLRNPKQYKALSPLYLIPQKSKRLLPPQLCMVGSLDIVTPPASIRKYRDRCLKAQQPIVYWRYKGKPHAFLDAKKNVALNINFTRDAPVAIDRMVDFFNAIFYSSNN